MQLFVFLVDDQRLALPASVVREVIAAVAVTPLPAAPRGIAGMIDVRGDLAPVYDLRARFGRSMRRIRASEHFILATVTGRLVAIRADRAIDLLDVADDDVTRPAGDDAYAHLAGVARLPDGLLLIQDLAAFLSESDERALDDALAAARTPAPVPAPA